MKVLKDLLDKDLSELFHKGIKAFLIRIVGFISGYFFIYFTVKYYGAETQGRLALSYSFLIIGSLICRLGIDINLVKSFSIEGNIKNAKGIFFRLMPLVVLTSLFVGCTIYFFADYISIEFFNDPELAYYLKWIAPSIVLFSILLVNASVLRGLRFNDIYSFLFNGGRFLFSLVFLFALIFFTSLTYESVVIAHFLAILCLFLLSLYFIVLKTFPIRLSTEYNSTSFIKDSLPMLVSSSMIIFLGWADTIILGIFKDSSVVGIYSVILKIAVLVSFSFQALDSILAPKLSLSFHNEDYPTFKRLVRVSTYFNIAFSLILIFGILFFKDLILHYFGNEFMIGSSALIILCFGQLFNAVCGPVGSILQMTGHQKTFQNILLIALVINISLNLTLVEKHGIDGVAVATAVSLAFWNFCSLIYIRKNIYSKFVEQ